MGVDFQESIKFCSCFVYIVKIINNVLIETLHKLVRKEALPSAEGQMLQLRLALYREENVCSVITK